MTGTRSDAGDAMDLRGCVVGAGPQGDGDGVLGVGDGLNQGDFSGRWKRPASFTPRLRCVGPVQP